MWVNRPNTSIAMHGQGHAVGVGEPQQAEAFAEHQDEQQRDAAVQVAARCALVRQPAAQGAGKQRQQAEAAGRHAGLALSDRPKWST
jgi:hypothetical protein